MKHLIVMPAYNEEEAMPQTVASLAAAPPGFEAVIVNDGSTDRTGEVAERLVATSPIPLHVLHLPANCGIGVAVQTGYRFAAQRGGYTYVIQFDSDGQHPADALGAIVERCERDRLDVCIGSRFLTPADGGFRSTRARRVGIRFFSWLIRRLVGLSVTDPTSGFRCVGPRAWNRFADFYPEDYPEPESLFWCARNRLRVGELPVVMRDRQGGTSSIYRFRALYYMLKVSMAILFDRLRRREFHGMTAETLMLVGGLCAFLLTLHWVRARELREKYALYWLALAALLLTVGVFPHSLMWFADSAHLSYATAVLFLSLSVIYLFAFAVSVSLSTQYRRNLRLAQQLALLEERLRRLEGKPAPAPAETGIDRA